MATRSYFPTTGKTYSTEANAEKAVAEMQILDEIRYFIVPVQVRGATRYRAVFVLSSPQLKYAHAIASRGHYVIG